MKIRLFFVALATLLFSNGCTKSKSAPAGPAVSQTLTVGSTTSTVTSTYRLNGGADIGANSDGNYELAFDFPTAPVPGTYDVVDYSTPATGMQVKVVATEISPTTLYYAGAAPQAVTVTLNNGKYSIVMSPVTATPQQSTINLSVKMSASFSEK
ncbi:MAG TPA: hypothetical protein VGS79_08550 [Puia sp.]|nr:hypothetical protein [Puia sp.]